MMIAKKLLACATPAPVDPGSTLFLSNWATTGTPTAQVGAVIRYGATVTAAGVLDFGGGYVNCLFTPPASDDWVVDMFFDGSTPPEIGSAATTYLFWYSGYDGPTLYLSDNGLSWTHSATMPAGTAGRNHLAMGRQSGQMQAWLNGVRFLSGPAAGPYPWPPSGSDIQLAGGSVGPVRVVGADIYGNSATIAVPVEPLGIV